MLASLDRVMRLLRRRPAGKQHVGRGVYRILSVVHEHDKISTRELAELLDMRSSSLNEKLARLEHEGMLLRERDPSDQRIYLVKLELKGQEHLEDIKEERVKLERAINTILTEKDTKTMIQISQKLADGLEKLIHEAMEDNALTDHGSDK